ncbi:MAG: hypothetical protein U9O64_09360 [Campylobacterota bacterium]|nr:hypothetical protein [Campylobacterota bacterium]
MTKKEVSLNTTWDEFEMGTCRLFIAALNQYIPTIFFQDHKPQPAVSDKMLQSINDILEMNKDAFEQLNEILGTTTYQECKIKEIHIDQDHDTLEGVYSEVILSTNNNRYMNVIIKDGQFICINDGTYFETLS